MNLTVEAAAIMEADDKTYKAHPRRHGKDDNRIHFAAGKGSALCGARTLASTPLYGATPCDKCNELMLVEIENERQRTIKNWWAEHTAGRVVAEAHPPRRTKIKYEQETLPEEYLPKGSGHIVRMEPTV